MTSKGGSTYKGVVRALSVSSPGGAPNAAGGWEGLCGGAGGDILAAGPVAVFPVLGGLLLAPAGGVRAQPCWAANACSMPISLPSEGGSVGRFLPDLEPLSFFPFLDFFPSLFFFFLGGEEEESSATRLLPREEGLAVSGGGSRLWVRSGRGDETPGS